MDSFSLLWTSNSSLSPLGSPSPCPSLQWPKPHPLPSLSLLSAQFNTALFSRAFSAAPVPVPVLLDLHQTLSPPLYSSPTALPLDGLRARGSPQPNPDQHIPLWCSRVLGDSCPYLAGKEKPSWMTRRQATGKFETL